MVDVGFNILRNCQAVFQSDCTICISTRKCTGVPVAPCSRLHLMWPVFNFSHFKYILVSYFSFNLYLPNK